MKTAEKRYQVEMLTQCSGWSNTWTEEDELGAIKPQTFGSLAD